MSGAEIVDFGWWSLLPSLLAIIAALVTRQVYIALFLGVWSGAWLLHGMSFVAVGQGFLSVVDTWLLEALVPKDGANEHLSIALFTMLTGGMIGIISKNGGMGGIVRLCSAVGESRRKMQLTTVGFGGLIFFDDYANTLIVGNTMRPLADKADVSRAKLAYIVDSTAAPIACVALVTTWVGFQLSLIKDTLKNIPEITSDNGSAFEMLVAALPYSFYPILTLVFVVMVILSGRDFGPMLTAERRVRLQHDGVGSYDESEELTPPLVVMDEEEVPQGHPLREAVLAIIPILVLIIGTIVGLVATGDGDTVREILGEADPFKAMMWASLGSVVTAVGLSYLSGHKMSDIVLWLEEGFAPMLMAVVILTFAWAIADVNKALHTADFIVSWIGDGVSAPWLPVIIFIVAAMTAFATGASWGTMGILVPLILPLNVSVLMAAGVPAAELAFHPVLLASLASVLGGAVWGDHCSPISDTTILSSVASGCHHIEHVKTQMPYAITVALTSLVLGLGPSIILGLPVAASFLLCFVALLIVLFAFGKRPE